MSTTMQVTVGYNGTDKKYTYSIPDVPDSISAADAKNAASQFTQAMNQDTVKASCFVYIDESSGETYPCMGVTDLVKITTTEVTLMGGNS